MRVTIYILLLSFLLVACKNKNVAVTHEQKEHAAHNSVYTCPMHPEIVRDKPGNCPICGMPLVLKEKKSAMIKDVPLEALLKPTDEFVLSSVPLTAMEQSKEDNDFNAFGTVTYDNRQIATVSSRIEGRIERMYVSNRYQFINRGDKILDIYSPELVNSQQNLLFVLKSDPGNTSLINASKQRLYLLGMSNTQVSQVISKGKPFYKVGVFSNYSGYVNELSFNSPAQQGVNMTTDGGMNGNNQTVSTTTYRSTGINYGQATQELSIKEGMYLQKGQPILTVINPTRGLVLLNIFADRQNVIKKGDAVKISPEGAPSKYFAGRIDMIEPFYRPESKTLTARVYFNNINKIPIGSRVQATIFNNGIMADWLPASAVVKLGIHDVVFRKENPGFRAHRVTTGIRSNDKIQIITGLDRKDSVAINGQFLIGSESFIKAER
ncbi:efflux RND transporter periplasmic adaptor subunit [soil metagenome]